MLVESSRDLSWTMLKVFCESSYSDARNVPAGLILVKRGSLKSRPSFHVQETASGQSRKLDKMCYFVLP